MAQGDIITNNRIKAQWQIAATLNMGNANNVLLSAMKTQPDGAYSQANMNDWMIWLRLELGKDGSLAKWFPTEVYAGVIAKIEGYNYHATKVGNLFLPPETPLGGVEECTCDSDAYASRTVKCWKWDYVDFTEQAAGSEAGGTWTFSSLTAGNYVLAFDDALTAESFPTTYLTVTAS